MKVALGGHVAEIPGGKLVLYWPETYMNVCGKQIKLAMNKYKVPSNKNLLILHDCLETKLGKSKLQIPS